MKTLSPLSSQQEQTIKNLISDSIIFHRHCKQLQNLISSLTGNEPHMLEIEEKYTGCCNAITLLGIEDTEENYNLRESLWCIYFPFEQMKSDSEILAQEVLIKWKEKLKETNSAAA